MNSHQGMERAKDSRRRLLLGGLIGAGVKIGEPVFENSAPC